MTEPDYDAIVNDPATSKEAKNAIQCLRALYSSALDVHDITRRAYEALGDKAAGLTLRARSAESDVAAKDKEIASLLLRAEAAEKSAAHYKAACIATEHEIGQEAAEALGDYMRYMDDQKTFPGTTEADGYFLGEEVAESVVSRLCKQYKALRDSPLCTECPTFTDYFIKCLGGSTYTPFMWGKHVATHYTKVEYAMRIAGQRAPECADVIASLIWRLTLAENRAGFFAKEMADEFDKGRTLEAEIENLRNALKDKENA